jgi:hypothetical protein
MLCASFARALPVQETQLDQTERIRQEDAQIGEKVR